MPIVQPHLRFAGDARAAIAFYRSVFGGEATVVPAGDAVFHAELRADGFTLLLADGAESAEDGAGPSRGPADGGPAVSLHLRCADGVELRRLFDGLAEGGEVRCAIGPAFGGLYAEVTDRFGVAWFLTAPGRPEPTTTTP